MNILSIVPRFLASRHKTMLKRRKIAIKKRPISNKQLKQQAKIMNYSLQYKMLQIKKQLDRRANPNRHINELMEEIFYPDIAYMNQSTLQQTLQMEKSVYESSQQQGEMEENYIVKKIYELIMPEDLLGLHEELKELERSAEQELGRVEQQLINHKYYEAMINQLSYYFRNRDKIKQRLQKDWESKMKKMQGKDKDFKKSSCPYIFYDREDIYLSRPWIDFASDFAQFIADGDLQDRHSMVNNEHHPMGANVSNMFIEINIGNMIYDSLRSLPAEIYEKMIAKIMKFSQLFSQQSIINNLTLKEKVLIIYFVGLHKQLKYPEHTIIQLTQQHRQSPPNLLQLCQSLCMSIMRDPNCTSYHLATVMRAYQLQSLKFNNQFEVLSKQLVIKQMSSLPYEKILDYFVIYLNYAQQYDTNFIQLMKFDIFRKTTSAVSKKHLLTCLSMIHNGTLLYNTNALNNHTKQITGSDLFIKTAQNISLRYCSKDLLTPQQLINIMQLSLNNNITDRTLLELMANELVRNKDRLELWNLSECGFIVNILGYRSPIISQVIFEAFCDRYIQEYGKCEEKWKYLLTDKNDEHSEVNRGQVSAQIERLEQSLVMCIWMLITTLKSHNQSRLEQNKQSSMIRVPKDKLLKIYPLTVHSRHRLIEELSLNIYDNVKAYGMFWLIRTPQITTCIPSPSNSRLTKYYIGNRSNNLLINSLHEQANQSQQFTYNYNLITNKYLKQNWSAVNVYEEQSYQEWVWANRKQLMPVNYFNGQKSVSSSLQLKRQQIIAAVGSKLGSHSNEEGGQRRAQHKMEQMYEYYKLD